MDHVSLEARWDGPGWKWWALAAGVGLVLVTVVLAALASIVLDERVSALLTLGLLIELIALSMMGSGALSGTSRRMSRGGLARETATIDIDHKSPEKREAERERDRERRDRRTIRIGIMALPVFLTFVYMLAR
jgi:hypothetical protein